MTSTPSSKPSTEGTSVRTLLASIVDYAGLFPPAERDMEAAAAAFDRYRGSPHAWMLGSFVVPAARVEELARSLEGRDVESPRPLSVIVASAEEGARVVEAVRSAHADSLSVSALEVRPMAPEAIRGQAAVDVPEEVEVFYEVPAGGGTEAALDAVARVGARAKLRTGGITAEAFPSASAVAGFLVACRERGLALKATAGLHHPFAGSYPLTYEAVSACGTMHGFLGLTLVAALVHADRIAAAEAARLLDGGPERVTMDAAGMRWHGTPVAESEIQVARASFFRSFGSCSFEEPVEELRAAGLL